MAEQIAQYVRHGGGSRRQQRCMVMPSDTNMRSVLPHATQHSEDMCSRQPVPLQLTCGLLSTMAQRLRSRPSTLRSLR